jgi:hypothetical protein
MLSDIGLAMYLTLYYTITEIIVPSIVFIILITPLLYIITKVTQNIGVFK